MGRFYDVLPDNEKEHLTDIYNQYATKHGHSKITKFEVGLMSILILALADKVKQLENENK